MRDIIRKKQGVKMPLNGEDQLFFDFQTTWNLERVKNMKLDEYIKTGSTETFHYWLEEKMSVFGSIKGHFGGLSKLKFCICDCDKELGINRDLKYSSDQKYVWIKKYNPLNNDQNTAFETIRTRIIRVIEASQKNDLDAIENIDLEHVLKWKIAFHYQDINNIKIVDIFAQYALDYIKEKILNNLEMTTATMHHQLLGDKRYTLSTMRDEKAIPLWDECLAYTGYCDFRKKLKQYNETSNNLESAIQMHTKQDRKFYVLKNKKNIIAISVPLDKNKEEGSQYSWDAQNFIDYVIHEKLPHHNYYAIPIFHHIIKMYQKFNVFKKFAKKYHLEDNKSEKEGIVAEECSMTIIPPNQILYGPPGTGKTYHTINKALEILAKVDQSIDEAQKKEILEILENLNSNSPSPEKRQRAKEIFDDFKNKEQIEFITFHQSYGYEEFVEGIKPIPTEDLTDMRYETQDGVFKTICKNAIKNLKDSKKSKKEFKEDNDLHNQLVNFLDFCIENQKPISKAQGGSFCIQEYNDKRIYVTTDNTKKAIVLDLGRLEKILAVKADFDNATTMFENVLGLKNQQQATYYFRLYKEFVDFKSQNLISQEYSDEENILKSYILIIDEINRGNISKIFGELITLIEPSKRVGEKEELKVLLPYSGCDKTLNKDEKLFGVPNNLYIIGTMNTADRSITNIDTALRRRFEFVEMMPDPSKLNNNMEGINLKEILKAINERIEYLCGREKTIGHAYLLDVKNLNDLKERFQNKIIPLLQEYFYNDYEAIQAVLNDNGMIRLKDSKSGKQDFLAMGKFKTFVNDRGLDEKKVFEITPKDATDKDNRKVWDNPSTYTKIYGVDGDNKTQPNDDELDTPSESNNNQ